MLRKKPMANILILRNNWGNGGINPVILPNTGFIAAEPLKTLTITVRPSQVRSMFDQNIRDLRNFYPEGKKG